MGDILVSAHHLVICIGKGICGIVTGLTEVFKGPVSSKVDSEIVGLAMVQSYLEIPKSLMELTVFLEPYSEVADMFKMQNCTCFTCEHCIV